jgi:hypothetical protein
MIGEVSRDAGGFPSFHTYILLIVVFLVHRVSRHNKAGEREYIIPSPPLFPVHYFWIEVRLIFSWVGF